MALLNTSHALSILTIIIFFLVSFLIALLINATENKPYMDEIFHIPQAHKYCNGKFNEWDTKITTPPGLYIVTVGLLVPITKLLNLHLCEVLHLRFMNIIFATGNFYLIFSISRRLHQTASRNKLTFVSLNLACFPILYFFSFLYYTDSGSTFFVLLAYLDHLYGQNMMSAAFGAFSLLFRQTNIVWIFFMAGEKVVDIISTHLRIEKKKSTMVSKGSFQYLGQTLLVLLAMPFTQRRSFINMIMEILKSCGCYLVVFGAFILFVLCNGGVAVGDRDAHQIYFHLPQAFYFLGLFFAFAITNILSVAKLAKFWHLTCEKPVLIVGSVLCMAVALRYLTYVHIYLISDNRHYTFYIWKYFLGYDGLRYCFIPVYIYSGWAMLNLLSMKNALWKLLLTICILIATAPQKLLELRYFIIPYLMVRLHTPVGTNFQLIGEQVTYMFVNAVTIYIFTQHSYKWEGSHEIQRFMW